MKILQLITELAPAGAERVVCELSKELKKRGHTVLVVSLKPYPQNRTIIEELEASDIKVLSLNVTKVSLWRLLKIKKIIKDFCPDIVHSHLIHSNIISRIAKLSSPVKFKLINTVHISERRKDKYWHFWLDRMTYGICDCQSAVSKAVRDFHSKKIGKRPDLMPVIYNGLSKPAPMEESEIERLRREWGVSGCTKVIGSVGRLDPQKGYDIFLKQLPEISKIVPPTEKWGIVILGEGKQHKELEEIIKNINVKNIIAVLPGFCKQSARYMAAFDLFVMPSRYEGFGLTLLEAMMQGLPILASNVDSLPELMRYYKNGKCIDFKEIEQLLVNIPLFINKKIISDCPDEIFSVTKMTDLYIQLYKTTSESRPGKTLKQDVNIYL